MNFKTFILLSNLICVYAIKKDEAQWGGLYPRESTSREVRSLDGLWDFRVAPLLNPDEGFKNKWYKGRLKWSGPVIKMAVPSSYNDVTQSRELRDHIGWAWYDRPFFVPKHWFDEKLRIVFRMGSAHYNSIVYINGAEVASHEGGHLPVMAEISKNVVVGENTITICLNNTLTPLTIPQGQIIHKSDLSRYPAGYFTQILDFDFFNYAGIHRPVFIYTTPEFFIEDIEVKTDINGTTGLITYEIKGGGGCVVTSHLKSKCGCSIKVYDGADRHIKSGIGCQGEISIENATFWWPYLMADTPGYQYTLVITLSNEEGKLDTYPQKVGIRKLSWNSTTFTINGKNIYLMGCGKHEDANIRGKGLDYALLVKDFSLLKWLGANSFRASHYPYAEEIMDMADGEGIMVIDESPAVGLHGFGEKLLDRHLAVMQELIRRDKNRPSVIMWSVGNEPQSTQEPAKNYFQKVVEFSRSLDQTRPVTCALSAPVHSELAAFSLDIILVNRYYSWYGDTGHLEVIYKQTTSEFTEWHLLHNKPVVISEYGAGSLAGLHMDPSFTWSEEYQVDLMRENFKAFDDLRSHGFFVGEMIWNFADFATAQETFRPPGCMKGLFTRERTPKMAAHLMKSRYHNLASRIYGMNDNVTGLFC